MTAMTSQISKIEVRQRADALLCVLPLLLGRPRLSRP
jgi:hypothetical protein